MDVHRMAPARELQMIPGDLVDIPVTGHASLAVTGEVHAVMTANDRGINYRIRVLTSRVGDWRVGSFYDVPHEAVQQIGLQGVTSWEDLIDEPRVLQYLGEKDRRALAVLDKAHAAQHTSIVGTMAVTGEVLEEIMRNREHGEPPLRPELGERGQVTWMVIQGNPEVGQSASEKPVVLAVRTFAGQSRNQLHVITTPELERRLALVLRLRLANLAEEAGWFVENNQKVVEENLRSTGARPRPAIDPGEAQAIAKAVKDFAAGQAEALGAVNANASKGELDSANTKIQELIKVVLADYPNAKFFLGFLTNAQVVQAAMWAALGEFVGTLPGQAAIVDFQNSDLSRARGTGRGAVRNGAYRNGQYLIVASRRFMYLLAVDGHKV